MYYFLLLFIIVLMVVINAVDRDILSPAMILCAVWLVCSSIAFSFKDQWNIDLSFKAMITIMGALLCFALGQTIGTLRWYAPRLGGGTRRQSTSTLSQPGERVVLSTQMNAVLLIGFLVTEILVFVFELRYARQMGNSKGVLLMLKYIRAAESPMLPAAVNILSRLCEALGIFYVYLLCRALVFQESRYSRYLLGVVLHAVSGWLTAGRTWMIYLFVEFFIFLVTLYKNKWGWKNVKNGKMVFLVGICFAGFLFLFPRLGLLIGKGVGRNSWELIGYYAGSSVALFSRWLNSYPAIEPNQYFGQHTLLGVYNALELIGFEIPDMQNTMEFVYIPHFYSNIFSSLRRYIQDYGYVGMLLFQLLWGMLYGSMYARIRKFRINGFLLLFYGTVLYPVVESPIEERVLSKLLTMSTVFKLLALCALYRCFVRKIKRVEGVQQNA